MSGIPKKTPEGFPATFATAAYLREEEPGVFRLYRDLVVEEKDPRTGKMNREKTGQSVCVSPIPLREKRNDDPEDTIVVRTFHPLDKRPLYLVEIHQ